MTSVSYVFARPTKSSILHDLGQAGVVVDTSPGEPVLAMADGMIIRARNSEKVGVGFYVLQIIMLPGFDSWTIRYARLVETPMVMPGQRVQCGERIGMASDPPLWIDLQDLKGVLRPIPIEA